MADELVGPETAKAGQEVAKFGSKLIKAFEKAETLPKAQAFLGKVIGAPIENLVGLVGDPLQYIRIRLLSYYQDKVEEILEQRGVKEPQAVSPSIAVPLIVAATNETREELRELWAKLLAAAMDPSMANHVRLELIEAVKRLAPIDARILKIRYDHQAPLQPNTVGFIAGVLKESRDEVEISTNNLASVNLMIGMGGALPFRYNDFHLSPLGRQLMRLVY
ncbi:MAG: Abi-alpha family protein [Rhodomicrobium sp.]